MSILFRPAYLGPALLVVGLLTGISWFGFSGREAGPTDTGTEADPAGEPTRPAVVCFGHVDAEGGVTSLAPLRPGRVAEVRVREGQAVGAGTVLVLLDEEEARLGVAEAEAALEGARAHLLQARELPRRHREQLIQQEAAVDAARHRLDAAAQMLERRSILQQQDLIGKSRGDPALARDVAIAQEQVREEGALRQAARSKLAELQDHDPGAAVARARAEVTGAEVRLRQAERLLKECGLKAPQAGTVLRILVNPGDVLGGPAQQPILWFCPEGPRVVRAEVEQEFAGRVAVGQPARVVDDVNPDARWRGRVARVADWYAQRKDVLREPTRFQDVRTVECIVEVEPGPTPPRLGQRVQVTLGPTRP